MDGIKYLTVGRLKEILKDANSEALFVVCDEYILIDTGDGESGVEIGKRRIDLHGSVISRWLTKKLGLE